MPQPEAPARLIRSAARLLAGLEAIGVLPQRRRELVRKAVLDCIPPVRRRAIDYLAAYSDDTTLSAIAAYAKLPQQTLRTALQDLECHGLVAQGSGVKSWEIAPGWTDHIIAAYYDDLATYEEPPEMSALPA